MKTAEEFFKSKHGGKGSDEALQDDDNFFPHYWIKLMEEYARLKVDEALAELKARLEDERCLVEGYKGMVYDRDKLIKQYEVDIYHANANLESVSQQLDQALADKKAAWVSVKEALPSKNFDVLVAGDGRISIGYLNTHGEWGIVSSMYFEPKFWQPLPPPPDQQENTNQLKD